MSKVLLSEEALLFLIHLDMVIGRDNVMSDGFSIGHYSGKTGFFAGTLAGESWDIDLTQIVYKEFMDKGYIFYASSKCQYLKHQALIQIPTAQLQIRLIRLEARTAK